jgi:hypothetical protein
MFRHARAQSHKYRPTEQLGDLHRIRDPHDEATAQALIRGGNLSLAPFEQVVAGLEDCMRWRRETRQRESQNCARQEPPYPRHHVESPGQWHPVIDAGAPLIECGRRGREIIKRLGAVIIVDPGPDRFSIRAGAVERSSKA